MLQSMENTSKISKLVLFLSILSFVIFIGSYIVKLAMMNQFFDAETMGLKSFYTGKDLSLALHALLPVFSISMISFLSFLFFYVMFIVLAKINLKLEGWLFIISIILLITAPLESYLLIKFDWEIIRHLQSENIVVDFVINLLKNRMTVLGPFPLVLLFSYFIIIFLALFKPLRKN